MKRFGIIIFVSLRQFYSKNLVPNHRLSIHKDRKRAKSFSSVDNVSFKILSS